MLVLFARGTLYRRYARASQWEEGCFRFPAAAGTTFVETGVARVSVAGTENQDESNNSLMATGCQHRDGMWRRHGRYGHGRCERQWVREHRQRRRDVRKHPDRYRDGWKHLQHR